MKNTINDGWRKRLAVQLAAQLPERPEDAQAVIDYLGEILRDFISKPGRPSPKLVDLNQIASSLRAKTTGNPDGSP